MELGLKGSLSDGRLWALINTPGRPVLALSRTVSFPPVEGGAVPRAGVKNTRDARQVIKEGSGIGRMLRISNNQNNNTRLLVATVRLAHSKCFT